MSQVCELEVSCHDGHAIESMFYCREKRGNEKKKHVPTRRRRMMISACVCMTVQYSTVSCLATFGKIFSVRCTRHEKDSMKRT